MNLALLTFAQSIDLENRNPILLQKVIAHLALVRRGEWDQIRLAGSTSIPIRTGGYAFQDSVWGGVVVFPDARGELHFTGRLPAPLVAQIEKGTFQSPSGNTYDEFLSGLQHAADTATAEVTQLVRLAAYAAIGVGAVWLYSELPRGA